jgi:hypothetical protein
MVDRDAGVSLLKEIAGDVVFGVALPLRALCVGLLVLAACARRQSHAQQKRR